MTDQTPERGPLLVVAAFWSDSEHKDLTSLTDGLIKGSGAVVTFTPEQANQPGLRRDLCRFQLEEAADWGEMSSTSWRVQGGESAD